MRTLDVVNAAHEKRDEYRKLLKTLLEKVNKGKITHEQLISRLDRFEREFDREKETGK